MNSATAPSGRAEPRPDALRVVIADPESASRRRLRTLLAGMPAVELVGECPDGEAAVQLAEALEPDVLMLELQLPGLSGRAVAEKLGWVAAPAVIFMTNRDRFDPRALEYPALDHLLKPIDETRLEIALTRAHLLAFREPAHSPPTEPSSAPDSPRRPNPDRLAVRSGSRIVLHELDDVDWIEAAGNYSRIHLDKRCVVVRRTVGELEAALDPQRFLRVHRSTIVNLRRIRALEPVFKGEYLVILQDGTRVSSSRSYRGNIQRLLSLCG